MSTRAISLAPEATRAMASCAELALLMETARPSALKRPLACAVTKGAATASIGRSRENSIATASAARAAGHTPPLKAANRARMTRSVLVRFARIETNHGTAGNNDIVAGLMQES